MHQKFDITLKALLKNVPKELLKVLTGYSDGVFIDAQFPQIRMSQPDLLIRLADGRIVHIEIQSTNDKWMVVRMFHYCDVILGHFHVLPIQIVLYVGDKPMRMKNSLVSNDVSYSFKIVDIRDVDSQLLLGSSKPEDWILSILCGTADVAITLRTILEKLSDLDIREKNDYILGLTNLADLRRLGDKVQMEVNNMPVTMNVKDSSLFRRGLYEGKQEGKQEGKREGKREGLIEGIELGLEIKFGSEGLELMDMVGKLNELEKLEALKGLIKKSDNMDELKVFLAKCSN